MAKLLAALSARRVGIDGGAIAISASAGVALLGDAGVETGDELMRAADRAMYRAKQRGGGYVLHAAARG